MQDLRSITGGSGGRIFGGERRLRPYPNQALKCPRCDSLNTKFCYYNNYNLSQPRHFCKNCRRYWTKGGVLRNVPVGGGCRKTKRSKPKPSTDLQKERKSNSHSSSESSSLTATTTNTVTEAASSSSAGLLGFPFVSQNPNPNPSFEPSMLENLEHNPNFESFCENGSFTSLMTVSNPSILGFNFNGISPFRLHQQQQEQERIRLEQEKMTGMVEEMKMQHELTAGCVDQTVPVSLPGFQNRMTNGELTALDWQSSGDHDHDHDHDHDQGLFDMANTVDHGYWSQSQWTDNDHPLYLP